MSEEKKAIELNEQNLDQISGGKMPSDRIVIFEEKRPLDQAPDLPGTDDLGKAPELPGKDEQFVQAQDLPGIDAASFHRRRP